MKWLALVVIGLTFAINCASDTSAQQCFNAGPANSCCNSTNTGFHASFQPSAPCGGNVYGQPASGCCAQAGMPTANYGTPAWNTANSAQYSEGVISGVPACNSCTQNYQSWPTSPPNANPVPVIASVPQSCVPQVSYPAYQPVCCQANNNWRPRSAHVHCSPIQHSRPQYQPSVAPAQTFTSSGGGVAQRKAQRAANMRLKGHVGGGLGGARYEGVGWSTSSAQSAIQHCCYWGQRPVHEIGVVRGPDGWYACVLYR